MGNNQNREQSNKNRNEGADWTRYQEKVGFSQQKTLHQTGEIAPTLKEGTKSAQSKLVESQISHFRIPYNINSVKLGPDGKTLLVSLTNSEKDLKVTIRTGVKVDYKEILNIIVFDEGSEKTYTFFNTSEKLETNASPHLEKSTSSQDTHTITDYQFEGIDRFDHEDSYGFCPDATGILVPLYVSLKSSISDITLVYLYAFKKHIPQVNTGQETRSVQLIGKYMNYQGRSVALMDVYGISNSVVSRKRSEGGGGSNGEEELCILCMERTVDTIIEPCNHMIICGKCADELRTNASVCPYCKIKMKRYVILSSGIEKP